MNVILIPQSCQVERIYRHRSPQPASDDGKITHLSPHTVNEKQP